MNEQFEISLEDARFSFTVEPLRVDGNLKFLVSHDSVEPTVFEMDFELGRLTCPTGDPFWKLVETDLSSAIESRYM